MSAAQNIDALCLRCAYWRPTGQCVWTSEQTAWDFSCEMYLRRLVVRVVAREPTPQDEQEYETADRPCSKRNKTWTF